MFGFLLCAALAVVVIDSVVAYITDPNIHDSDVGKVGKKIELINQDNWENVSYDEREWIFNNATEEELTSLRDKGIKKVDSDWSGNF